MAPKKTGKKVAPKTKKVAKAKATKKAPKAPKASKKKSAPKAKAPKVAKPKADLKLVTPKGAYLNKSELLNNFCVETGLSKKESRSCFEALSKIGSGELAKGRKFVIPGMARFVVKKRPATKERQGINPFTREPCVFKAKPASKTVRAYVVKKFKEL